MRRLLLFSFFPFLSFLLSQQNFVDSTLTFSSHANFLKDTISASQFSNGSTWQIKANRISNLPFRGVENILSLHPEYVIQDGEAHLRGSRAGEMGYYLEGMSIRDPVTGGLQDLIIDEAIEKIEINTGNFGVGYGNAVAGIIRQQMRTGGEDFSINLKFRGEPAKAGSQLGGTFASGYQNVVLETGGPLFFKGLRFFLVHEYRLQKDSNPRFYSPFAYYDEKANYFGYESIGFVDTVDFLWDGRFTPNNGLERNRTNATLLLNLDNFRAKISFALLRGNEHKNATPVYNLLNNRGGYFIKNQIYASGNFEYKISENVVSKLGVGYHQNDAENFDDIFGNHYKDWYDSDKNAQKGIEFYRDYPRLLNFHGFLFPQSGYPPFTTYLKRQSESFFFAGNIAWKFFRGWELKAGFDYQKYKLRYYSINASYFHHLNDSWTTYDDADDYYARGMDVNSYGYDVYGKPIDSGFDGPKKPVFSGAYLSAKYQKDKSVISAGLRVEYLDGDNRAFKNPKNPHMVDLVISPKSYYKADPELKLSPRFSVSLPASDQIRVFTSYGMYYQTGRGSERYYGNDYISYQLAGGYYNRKPFGFDLKPVKSENFEAGFTGMVFNIIHFKVSMFHRRVENQSAIDHMKTDSLSAIHSYEFLSNRVHSQTDGTNISVHFQPAGEISFGGDYSYTNARGLYSYAYDGIAPVTQKTMFPNLMSPLSYARKHRATLYFNFFIPENQGKILGGTGVELVYRISSGHPFTQSGIVCGCGWPSEASVDMEYDGRSLRPLIPLNSASTQIQKTMDIRIQKEFFIGEFVKINLFLDVENLFNEKFEENVYAFSGLSSTDNILPDSFSYWEDLFAQYGWETYLAFYRDINLRNATTYKRIVGKEMWNTPRQFRLGIELRY